MSASAEEQLLAARAQIAQLQAADLPSALHGLLQQAGTQLKPPRAGAPAAATAAAAAAASRLALVLGLLLVLERASALAQQRRDLKLVKDAHSQLAAAFQQHDWLWQLLLRKHLPDVLQHPAAAQRLLGALAALPASTQARAYRLWCQQLAAQPGLPSVPLQLQLALLEQLRQCFTVQSLDLGLPGTSEPLGQSAQQGSAASDAAAAAVSSEGLTGAEVHVALREQLPPLLQLLLLVTCSSGAATAGVAAEGGWPGELGSSGHSTANAPPAPSLSTVQSAVAARRDPRRRGASAAASHAAQPASALASSSKAGAPSSGSRGGTLESVLRHAVLLISRLSDPDALHEMLGIQLRRPAQLPAHGSGSDGGEGEDGERQQEQQRDVTGAAAAGQPQVLSRRDAERISTAAALIEVCLDGMLSLPPLAAAVHQQLHSKGNSNAAAVGGAAAGEAAADTVQEQQQDAAAELRTTAGLMLGMHRELSRMLAEHQQQLQGSSRTPAKLRQPAPLLSLPACQQLLCVLVDVHAGAGGTAGGPSSSGQQQDSGAVRPQFWEAAERPPAVLLVPPQLAVQGIELVRWAVEAGGPTFQPVAAAAEAPSWRVAMAAQVAAIYSACYQAIWGAKVLQSAEAYQLLLSAARLRRLLRPADGAAAAPAAADDEAAAEAALLAENAVGTRRRRQRSAAHEMPGLRAASKGTAAAGGTQPAAKRIKTERGGRPSTAGGDGSAVAELLQLFSSPALKPPASSSQHGQQQRAAGRKRITPVAVSQQQQGEPSEPQQQQQAAAPPHAQQRQQDKPARKRIVPQQIGPAATSSRLASAGPNLSQQGSGAAADAAHAEQQGEDDALDGQPVPPGWQQSQRRIIISKAANMTEEQQEEMWAAYIADKEFLAEMLGDADYQRWFDEAANPLRKQRQRPGGLEAAWAAVLGSRSAGSIVQQQLPRTLLEASVTMRWDAAAAACLGLLGALLRGVAGSRGSPAAGQAGFEQEQQQPQQQPSELEQLLQCAFSRQQREVGARVATRILGFTGATSISGAIQAAQRSPAGACLVLLAAQMLGLAQGHNYFQQLAVSGLSYQGVPVEQQRATDGGGVVAPPLLEAYAQLLAALLPHAQQEAAASAATTPGTAHLVQVAKMCHPLSVTAQMAEHLLRLPPPLHHMLGPGCAALLRVAAASRDSDAQRAAQQHAALLWMLVQPQQTYMAGAGDGVELPADCPAWLHEDALLLERSCTSIHQHRSDGHALLLGPALEVQRAAALELLQQLRMQLEALQQRDGGLPADVLVVAADACHAAMQRLLLESHARRGRQPAHEGGSDAETDSEEEQQGEPLLLGGAAAAEVAALAAALCAAGAAAAESVAAALDVAAASGSQASQQQPRKRAQQQQQQAQQQPAGDQACAAVAEAAGVLVLCNQLLEPADQLLQSGCLPPAAQKQLEAACELLDGQGQAVGQLSDGLPPRHPLTAAIQTAMAEAPALWQPAPEAQGQRQADSEAQTSGSGGSSEEEEAGLACPAGQQRNKARGGKAGASGKAGSSKQQAAARPKGRSGQRRKMGQIRNPAVRAMLAEDGRAGLDDDDLSDLEDFLVFNPERDYDAFFKRHFWQARGSDSEEDEEEAGVHGEGQGEEEPAAEEQAGTGAGQEAGHGAGEPAEEEQQAARQRQRQQQRQRQPAKPRDRARPAAKQQQRAVGEEQRTMLGSVAAAAAAAGAAAAAKRQGNGQAGSKSHFKRKR